MNVYSPRAGTGTDEPGVISFRNINIHVYCPGGMGGGGFPSNDILTIFPIHMHDRPMLTLL